MPIPLLHTNMAPKMFKSLSMVFISATLLLLAWQAYAHWDDTLRPVPIAEKKLLHTPDHITIERLTKSNIAGYALTLARIDRTRGYGEVEGVWDESRFIEDKRVLTGTLLEGKWEYSEVAVIDGSSTAYLIGVKGGIKDFEIPPHALHLLRMAVLPDYRGLSIGSILIRNLAVKADMEGFTEIYVDVLKTRTDAIRFYRKCGFADFKDITDPQRPNAPCVRMKAKVKEVLKLLKAQEPLEEKGDTLTVKPSTFQKYDLAPPKIEKPWQFSGDSLIKSDDWKDIIDATTTLLRERRQETLPVIVVVRFQGYADQAIYFACNPGIKEDETALGDWLDFIYDYLRELRRQAIETQLPAMSMFLRTDYELIDSGIHTLYYPPQGLLKLLKRGAMQDSHILVVMLNRDSGRLESERGTETILKTSILRPSAAGEDEREKRTKSEDKIKFDFS